MGLLDGRKAIITGGGGGIGAATARLLGSCNARVAIHYGKSRAEAEEVAQEVLRAGGDSVGLSTVYRTLQAMADAGQIDVLRSEAGESVYRRCSTTHHHHLVCRSCGATVEIEGPAVESWTRSMAAHHGYRDIAHTLEIFGTCASC